MNFFRIAHGKRVQDRLSCAANAAWMQDMNRPKMLCMVDLKLAPDALQSLREIADVDHLPIDRALLLKRIGGVRRP